jgi:uncharacterized protein YecT (DUF1311 family)
VTKIGFGLLLFFASTLTYSAENAPRTKEYGRCIDKAGAVDPAVLECISEEYARQDKRSNAAYRNLMGSLKGERKKRLLEAQRL